MLNLLKCPLSAGEIETWEVFSKGHFWGGSFRYLRTQGLCYIHGSYINMAVLVLQNSLWIWFLDLLSVHFYILQIDH